MKVKIKINTSPEALAQQSTLKSASLSGLTEQDRVTKFTSIEEGFLVVPTKPTANSVEVENNVKALLHEQYASQLSGRGGWGKAEV